MSRIETTYCVNRVLTGKEVSLRSQIGALVVGACVQELSYNNNNIGDKMNMPQTAANNYTTEQLLETALALLDSARREQAYERTPVIDKWLTNNFTLEIIRAKVAANKANATINV